MDNFIGIKLKKIIRIISDFSHILATNSKDFKNDFCNEENFNIELIEETDSPNEREVYWIAIETI